MSKLTEKDTSFLKRAIELAQKGRGFTSPNPVVGAVLVKGGKIIGEGWHKRAGTPHAEINAIADARKKEKSAKGSTLYVTLEPCCHVGTTGKCSQATIAAGIKRVFIGMRDPHEVVDGGGIRELRRAGIEVVVLNKKSVLAQTIRNLNQPFLKWATTGLPYVTLKAGVSLDGKIATHTGSSKWITGEQARRNARVERSVCDAVVVGSGTVLADNPELAAHGRHHRKDLLRVIIDRKLRTAALKKPKIFRDEYVLVVTTDAAPKTARKKLERAGVNIVSFGRDEISVKKLLQYLGKQRVTHVYVEGGSAVHGLFHDTRLVDPLAVDRVLWYIAPTIIGGGEALAAVAGKGIKTVDKAINFLSTETSQIGDDIRFEGVLNSY